MPALDDDLLDGIELELGAILDECLLEERLELLDDELVAGAEELIITDDLLELEIIVLDDDLAEELNGVLDATDDAVEPHKLPITLGAPAVPFA